jgi:hypothetical protein
VLETASGLEALVTSAGQDQLFVFGVPSGLALPPLTPGAPVLVASVPADAPLALVVTLEGGILPGAEPAPAIAATAGGAEGTAEAAEPGGPNPFVSVLVLLAGGGPGQDPPARDGEFGDSIDDLLRRIDLYGPLDEPAPQVPNPSAGPRDEARQEEGPAAPREPMGRPAPPPGPVRDAAWLDGSPLRAERPQEEAQAPAPRWGEAVLAAVAVSGLSLWGQGPGRERPRLWPVSRPSHPG